MGEYICKNCRFWRQIRPIDPSRETIGECQQKPPVILTVFDQDDIGTVHPDIYSETSMAKATQFPHTYHDQWCGYWQDGRTKAND